jgi:hypothetical protein
MKEFKTGAEMAWLEDYSAEFEKKNERRKK